MATANSAIFKVSIATTAIVLAYLISQVICALALEKLTSWPNIKTGAEGFFSLLLLSFSPLLVSAFIANKIGKRWATFHAVCTSRSLLGVLTGLYLFTFIFGVPALHAQAYESKVSACFDVVNAKSGVPTQDCGDYIAIPLLPKVILYCHRYMTPGYYSEGVAEVYFW